MVSKQTNTKITSCKTNVVTTKGIKKTLDTQDKKMQGKLRLNYSKNTTLIIDYPHNNNISTLQHYITILKNNNKLEEEARKIKMESQTP